MKLMKQEYLIGAAVVVVMLAAGYILSDLDTNSPAENVLIHQPNVVYVEDQKVTDGKVRVGFVVLADEGFVGIHLDEQGEVGPLVGTSQIMAAGGYEKFQIALDKSVAPGTKMWAVLYRSNKDDDITFAPGKDEPFLDAKGNKVSMQFTTLEKDPNFSDVAL
jgi:hypothetical protein